MEDSVKLPPLHSCIHSQGSRSKRSEIEKRNISLDDSSHAHVYYGTFLSTLKISYCISDISMRKKSN